MRKALSQEMFYLDFVGHVTQSDVPHSLYKSRETR
jgi:hypothetical protein